MSFEEKHEPAGMMSFPPIDSPDFTAGPHASTYVCAADECQIEAAEYIRHQTGHAGVFRPFQSRKD